MNVPLAKLAPTAIVLAMTAWCCWPHVFGESGGLETPESGKAQRMTSTLLSPEFAPPSDRNPFRPPAAAKPPVSKELPSKPGVALVPKMAPVSKPEPPAAKTKPKPPPEEDPRVVVGRLTLNATYVQGTRRVAMINGAVYRQGDRLPIEAPAAEGYLVGKITPHNVLIVHGGHTMVLKYRDLVSGTQRVPSPGGHGSARKPKPGPAPAARARPASARSVRATESTLIERPRETTP